jgi:hypothetical protein
VLCLGRGIPIVIGLDGRRLAEHRLQQIGDPIPGCDAQSDSRSAHCPIGNRDKHCQSHTHGYTIGVIWQHPSW